MLSFPSKLPAQGVTIFSQMSALAQRLNALNLSQGFPDFAAPEALLDCLVEATRQGFNQYAAGDGWLPLREQVAQQFAQRDQLQLDITQEITITSGATIALYCAIQALIHAGDEVIIFDPSYDRYAPAVELAEGVSVRIPLLTPDFQVDWQRVKDSINSRTRMIIINTPHNPSGAIWSKQDWLTLIELIEAHNIVVLSDEVYEHLIYDGQRHYSALSFPELRQRSLVVGSFGKTFHVTGWKTGYCVAAPELMHLFRQVYHLLASAAIPRAKWHSASLCNSTQNIFSSSPVFISKNVICLMQGWLSPSLCLHRLKAPIFKMLPIVRFDLT
ncbi:hypothetical protein F975_02959 [Acinetobacter sp. ANC 3789]|nr:hypothetical protein F975_02959 [Acinetobacter sp. ANC 3789]